MTRSSTSRRRLTRRSAATCAVPSGFERVALEPQRRDTLVVGERLAHVANALGADVVTRDVPALEGRVAARAKKLGDGLGAAVADDVVAEQEALHARGELHRAQQRANALGTHHLLAEVEAPVGGERAAREGRLALDGRVVGEVREERREVIEVARDDGLGLGLRDGAREGPRELVGEHRGVIRARGQHAAIALAGVRGVGLGDHAVEHREELRVPLVGEPTGLRGLVERARTAASNAGRRGLDGAVAARVSVAHEREHLVGREELDRDALRELAAGAA